MKIQKTIIYDSVHVQHRETERAQVVDGKQGIGTEILCLWKEEEREIESKKDAEDVQEKEDEAKKSKHSVSLVCAETDCVFASAARCVEKKTGSRDDDDVPASNSSSSSSSALKTVSGCGGQWQ